MDLLCETFDPGAPSQPASRLPGGSSATPWRLRTTRGEWIVKATGSPADRQLHEMRVSGVLEQSADRAGVALPRPVEPPEPRVGH
jgi:hypothetical protein